MKCENCDIYEESWTHVTHLVCRNCGYWYEFNFIFKKIVFLKGSRKIYESKDNFDEIYNQWNKEKRLDYFFKVLENIEFS